jgi:hypothetical protein
LTANLLLRRSSQPSRDPRRVARERVRGLCPERPRERCGAVLAGPRSTAPPRHTSRSRCFRPRAELATSPLTSSVTTLRGLDTRQSPEPNPRHVGPPGPDLPAVSSKTAVLTGPGRLPSPSAPSPGHAPRFRAARVGSRGARHRCRCSRARGSRHCDPASGALSPLELPRARRGSRGLDPWPFGWTERRSSTSATKRSPRARPQMARFPSRRGTDVRSRAPPAGLVSTKPPALAAMLGRSLARRRSNHLENGWRRRYGSPLLHPFGRAPFGTPSGYEDPGRRTWGDPRTSDPVGTLGRPEPTGPPSHSDAT